MNVGPAHCGEGRGVMKLPLVGRAKGEAEELR